MAGVARDAVVELTTLAVPEEDARALSTDVQAMLAQLPTALPDHATYSKAKESLPVLKKAEDRVVTFFREIKDAAFKAHRTITAKESAQLKPIAEARQQLARLIYAFELEQERVRRQAEREAAEAARQEQERLALEEAAALEADAPEMAAQIVEQAIAAPAPTVILPSARVDVSGVSLTANWQFKYAGCASGLEWDKLPDEDRQRVLRLMPREYLRPDEKALGKIVKAMKGATRIPGIEVFDAGSVRVRG